MSLLSPFVPDLRFLLLFAFVRWEINCISVVGGLCFWLIIITEAIEIGTGLV